jgi:cytochrome c-type biogenesis protein
MTESWVEYVTGPWGFAFAFAAGVLSFLSPCVLPLVPAYLAHLTGTTATLEGGPSVRRSAVTHALFFVAGFALVFSLLAASVGLLAYFVSENDAFFFRTHDDAIRQVAGVVLIVLGLNLMGVIRIPLLYRTYSLDLATATSGAGGGGATMQTATVTAGGGSAGGPGSAFAPTVNYSRSVLLGASFAAGWTPCIGPVLGAIFTLAVESADAFQALYLMLVYSLGLGVPFVATAFAIVPVTAFLRRHRNIMPVAELTAGALVILIGVLFVLNEGTLLNSWFSDIPGLDRFNEI